LDDARVQYEHALAQFEQLDDRIGAATTLTNLGLVRAEQDQASDAADLHERAMHIFEEIGDQANLVETLNNLGTALTAAGRIGHAIARHHQALTEAERQMDRVQAARAHSGLALARLAESDRLFDGKRAAAVAGARTHSALATAAFDELGIPWPDELSRAVRLLSD
jgi:tetratricopeptide (TPR) repeat protein